MLGCNCEGNYMDWNTIFDFILDHIEWLVGLLLAGITTIWHHFKHKKHSVSESRQKYDALRCEIATALTMYACCFNNPIDLATTKNNEMPPEYVEGQKVLRSLGAQIRSLAETLPEKVKDLPISKSEMTDASGYLIGLSNSFITPYGYGSYQGDRDNARHYEKHLREILNLT